ncbi:Spermidine/putrescine-binding periplasmic protein precursor [Micromonospora sp. MW-13]|uniref:ABC transporter substrate-binding protein n=1 Tax=Micromonospora sp. MW-13 TaxID=2094022 RepID=UPI000ED3A94B|nr:ABC transporter substrate-binding protein [Micromonospora sp. MW-13]RGC66808.1 Spermidine/putrescine-binding periplasmic protein precursor [Micromonospora sp. MW-13]
MTRRISRRALLPLLLAPVVALSACSTGGDSDGVGDGETTIRLMAYATGGFKEKYLKSVVEQFEKTNPGIKVEYDGVVSSAEMLGRLRTQKSNPTIDVVIMDLSVAESANKENIFAPLDPAAVPNMKDLSEHAKVRDNFGPGVTFDNLTLAYNTKAVTTAPTSWNDLWDPAHKGKVSISAPPQLDGIGLTVILGDMLGVDYQRSIDPVVGRLRELAPSVQTWNPQPDTYTLVKSGQVSLALAWNARSQLQRDLSDGALGVALPKEGSIMQVNTINLVKGSKRASAAQTFINYALGPEAQAAFAAEMFYAPTNTLTKVSDAVAQRTVMTPEKLETMIPVDWNWLAEHRAQWTDIWREDVISK